MEGSFVRQFGYLPDFMATCVELAGAAYPESVPPCEGVSMLPLLDGSRIPIHTTPIYWEHEGNAGVRWEKWKLVRVYKKPWELYNIDADRAEMHDLAKKDPQKTLEMIELWTDWARHNQVSFPKRFNMYDFLKKQKAKGNQSPLSPDS
jgi:arylsulfatase A-like enzyme